MTYAIIENEKVIGHIFDYDAAKCAYTKITKKFPDKHYSMVEIYPKKYAAFV